MVEVHPNFSINGKNHKASDLPEVAYSFIKEGEDFEKYIGEFLLNWIDNETTITVFTSGSTGRPKPILLQKKHMVNSAIATGEYFDLKPNDKALLCLSANYIAGKMMLVRAMVLGLDLYIVAPCSKPLDRTNLSYDFGAMVPLQVQGSLSNLYKIKKLIIGGAPISNDLRDKLKKVDNRCFETYGMTETVTHIALKPLNHVLNSIVATDLGFKTLTGVKISKDTRGCLVIDAPNISDDVIVTNDMVELISHTEFRWLGRFDNVINSGGVKLYPEEIESVFSKHIENRFFVAGLPSKQFGEEVVLLIEGHINKKQLQEVMENDKGLTKYQVPKKIVLLPAFIETESGKIKRHKTLELLHK